jgi:diketogulonate reductase-like aldo/keto reductase
MNARTTVKLHTGREMPIIGLGTWKLTHNTAGIVSRALQSGYRMVDTSGDYGTQPGVGEGIRQSGLKRDDIYLVTKIEETDDAYQATIDDLDELQLDYANLMLIHRPPEANAGEELWQGLMRAKAEGYTRDIGVSNYTIDEMEALISVTGEVPVVNQIEWSPFGHSQEMLDYCRENDIIIQAYSPLTRGDRTDDTRLEQIAIKYGKTPAQIMLRWNIQLGTVPLPKANSIQHLEENLNIFDFELSDADMAKLTGLNRQYSALGSLAYV